MQNSSLFFDNNSVLQEVISLPPHGGDGGYYVWMIGEGYLQSVVKDAGFMNIIVDQSHCSIASRDAVSTNQTLHV